MIIGAIPLGIYTDSDPNFSTTMDFQVGSSDEYLAGTIIDSVGTITITNHLNIVITAIDSVSVSGTFSGDVFVDYATAGKKRLQTEISK